MLNPDHTAGSISETFASLFPTEAAYRARVAAEQAEARTATVVAKLDTLQVEDTPEPLTPGSTALVDVLRYHAAWATGVADFAAESLDPDVYAVVLAAAVGAGLVGEGPGDNDDATTPMGLAVLAARGITR